MKLNEIIDYEKLSKAVVVGFFTFGVLTVGAMVVNAMGVQ